MFVTNGLLFVALLRLMFVPFGGTSYLLGVTSVGLLDFMLGTAFYIFKIILGVFLGCTLYLAEEQEVKGDDH